MGYLLPPLIYFNPRPRKEGDKSRRGDNVADGISIHALAKRATKGGKMQLSARVISIHALAKRATKIYDLKAKIWNISIHALAKRATANLYNDYLYFEAKYHISDIFPL